MPITRSEPRGIPYPRASSEVVAFSLCSIGPSPCQSGSLTLSTVRLSDSVSAQTTVILVARSSNDHGRKEDPHHNEERASTALNARFSFLNTFYINKLNSRYDTVKYSCTFSGFSRHRGPQGGYMSEFS